MTKVVVHSVVLTLVMGCASQAPTQVTGTATYLERGALQVGAVFEATLEDLPKSDGKAEILGAARIKIPGTSPIAFAIPYDAADVDPRHRYAIRARITLQKQAHLDV